MAPDGDEQPLIRGLRAGDRHAWEALYDAYNERVWRQASRLTGNSGCECADIIQETFVAAARAIRQFDPARGSLGAWLSGIVHRQAALFWRQHSQQQRLLAVVRQLSAADPGAMRGIDSSLPPDELLEHRELAVLVRAALSELPEGYAAVLIDRYLDDRSIEEIAGSNGESYEAVRSRLARARQEFRDVFMRFAGEQLPCGGVT